MRRATSVNGEKVDVQKRTQITLSGRKKKTDGRGGGCASITHVLHITPPTTRHNNIKLDALGSLPGDPLSSCTRAAVYYIIRMQNIVSAHVARNTVRKIRQLDGLRSRRMPSAAVCGTTITIISRTVRDDDDDDRTRGRARFPPRPGT